MDVDSATPCVSHGRAKRIEVRFARRIERDRNVNVLHAKRGGAGGLIRQRFLVRVRSEIEDSLHAKLLDVVELIFAGRTRRVQGARRAERGRMLGRRCAAGLADYLPHGGEPAGR